MTQTGIALFCPSMHGGGAERATLNLASALAEHGLRVDLVLACAIGPLMAQVPSNVRVVDLGAQRVLTSLPALVRYLRRERPPALISALDFANIVAIWSRRIAGVPTRLVVSERNTMSVAAHHTVSRRERFMPRLVRFFYPWADEIVAVSRGVADDLVRLTGIPASRVRVIYNATVVPALFKRAKETLTHPWFGSGMPPVIVAAGRLTLQKDYPTLLRAFAAVRAQRPARLLILGEGEARTELEALVRTLKLDADVLIPGFAKNPSPYMAHAGVFVLSSAWEGLPNALIEALALGTPVVSTDCPSGPREILEGGKWGRLVPVGDPPALAAALLAALSEPRPSIPDEAIRRFTPAESVRQYCQAAGLAPAAS
jgi:glycosyltransferase involved in cell wall biosynthesis